MTDDDPPSDGDSGELRTVRRRPFALDLTRPLGTARGDIDRREGFVVTVDPAGNGSEAVGVGEATPLPGWTESYEDCGAELDAVGHGDGSDALRAESTPAARHGVSLALADAAAREAGRSLAERLANEADVGASPADAVPVNATVGDGSAAETAAAAAQAVDEGFDCLKLKVGARDVEGDVERVRAVREAVGDAVSLRADANGAWDREAARCALDALAAFDLAYVEQPLPVDDLDGLAALRGEARGGAVPVAADESVAARGIDAVLEADAADAVVLKPMALGGPDRALAAALRARSAGVDPVVTTTVDAVVARTAAVHVAAAIPEVSPCGLATGTLLDEDLAPDPCPIDDGRMAVPTGPGLAGGAFDDLRRE
ncbi:o-succinylbenzoate synthase [Halorubrum sp. RMP-47]|uniref:o-succinylbenzoate synthase n=1 Tax=Halorubrum miltondacostae TaxID=3076378 RepID=A0ABD5M2F7_9EURY